MLQPPSAAWCPQSRPKAKPRVEAAPSSPFGLEAGGFSPAFGASLMAAYRRQLWVSMRCLWGISKSETGGGFPVT